VKIKQDDVIAGHDHYNGRSDALGN